MEKVAEIEKILFVNDAASCDSLTVCSALSAFNAHSVIWIAGGEKTPITYRELLTKTVHSKVKAAIFFGERRQQLFKTWQALIKAFMAPELNNAVELAVSIAKKEDVVLFSPGLPPEKNTHGSIQNRGNDFRRCVHEIQEIVEIRKSLNTLPKH